MPYLENFYVALRAVIAPTWTDVKPNGIWENEHQEMVPWADLTPPCAAIVLSDLPYDGGEYGSANQVYIANVDIYYVGATTGDGDTVRGKLESLRDALLAATLSTGQVIDVTALSWSDQLAANVVFLAKDYTHRAGRLTAECIVGTAP